MATHWTTVALCSFLLAASASHAWAELPASTAEQDDKWCSQYECAVSAPLSETEVQTSLAYLAGKQPK